ncbi:MAG: alanine--glyoxylate aminotransferase family protein [Syntrophaceticus sp.]
MEKKQYLLLPGPTPVPPDVLRGLVKPMINHRGPEFKELFTELTEGLKDVFRTENDVIIFPSAGTGGMEAAVANFISPGEKVLVVSIGNFGDRFAEICRRFGAIVEKIDFPWGTAADPDILSDHIKKDTKKEIKAVFVTHNETSTGVTNDLPKLRNALGDHPALFIVDSVSGLGAMELETDAWNLDVVIAGSQKSFMVPPGLSFVAVSERAWEAAEKCTNACYYWDILTARKYAKRGQTPYTPALSQMNGLVEALKMIKKEGLSNIIARHERFKNMVRAGVRALGLELLAADEVASNAVTAVIAPPPVEADAIRLTLLERFNVVIAGGQNQLKNKVFRIGHLGYVQELDILAVLAALEMSLVMNTYEVNLGQGVRAAQEIAMQSMD